MSESIRYIKYFLSLKASADILYRQLFPHKTACKEISETIAIYRAVADHLKLDTNRQDILVVVPGDGVTPRTAATFAFLTKWKCLSIDLAMKEQNWDVQRLTAVKANADNYPINAEGKEVIVLYCHSHSNLLRNIQQISNSSKLHVVAMPCCTALPHQLMILPHLTYRDQHVWSTKNDIHIWKELKL